MKYNYGRSNNIYDKKKEKKEKIKYNQGTILFIRNQITKVRRNQLSSIVYIIDPIAYFRRFLIVKTIVAQDRLLSHDNLKIDDDNKISKIN